jgi:hypothetical protein
MELREEFPKILLLISKIIILFTFQNAEDGGLVTGSCEHGNEPSDSKRRGDSQPALRLACQEGPLCLKLT